MAATDAIVNVKVVGLQSLTALDNSFDRLRKKIGGVQGAIAGLGLASFTRSAFLAADGMSDLANATGIAISQILELQVALELAGGRQDQVNAAITRFSLSIDEARQGSIQLQDTFAELGVSLDDLAKLTDEQILQEVAKGFADVETKGRAAALANDIFGKSLRGTDIKDFAAKLLATQGTQDKFAESVKRAAELQGKLDVAIIKLKITLLEVLRPFVEFIISITDAKDPVETLTFVVKGLTAALLLLAGGALGRAIASTLGIVLRSVRDFGKLFTIFRTSGQVAAQTASTMGKVAEKTAAAAKSTGELAKQTDQLHQASTAMNALRGGALLAGVAGAAGIAAGGGLFGGKGASGTWEEAKATEALGKAENYVVDERQQAIAQIREIGKNYSEQQALSLKNVRRQIDSLTLTKEQAAGQNAYNETLDRANEEIRKLEDAKSKLSEKEKYQAKIYQEQIDYINKRKEADANAAKQEASNLQTRLDLNEQLLFDIEMINKAMSDNTGLNALKRQSELIGLIGDDLDYATLQYQHELDLQTKLDEIEAQRRLARGSLVGKELQQRLDNLKREENAARESAARKLDIETQLLDKTKALRDDPKYSIRQKIEELTRSVDPATMAMRQLDSVINNTFQALETALDTGKFNFKDFALSVIADLARIEAQAILTNLILSVLGGFFGKVKPTAAVSSPVSPMPGVGFAAKGAKPLSGQPFIVGEQGPELFVPKTAGTIVPNGNFGMNQNAPITNNYNTYNIQAIDAKSVAQLFAENRKTLLGTIQMAQKEMPR